MSVRSLPCDIAVLGGGPAGYSAALYAARTGLEVALVERDRVGGVCLHRGCIPSKHFLETAAIVRTVSKAGDFGVQIAGEPKLDWACVLARKDAVIGRLHKGLQGLLSRAGVRVIGGRGRVEGDGTVLVYDSSPSQAAEVTAVVPRKGTIVATGSLPRDLPELPWDGQRVITSDESLSLDEIPRRLVVVGAGSVGLEAASYFRDFGSEVVVLEALERALPGSDEELGDQLVKALASRGVRFHFGVRVRAVRENHSGTTVANTGELASVLFESSSGEEQVEEADVVLLAVGRKPNTAGIGLEEAGVSIGGTGHVDVDSNSMRTSNPRIWAVGDVVATPALAHVAFAEGMVAVRAIAGEDPRPLEYGRVPVCVYTHPELAYAGMTERDAVASYGRERIRVAKVNFAANSRASIMGERGGAIKVVALADGPILGVHVLGHMASELLSPGYLSVNWEAMAEDVAAFVQPHPTLSEMYGEAAMQLEGRPLHG